MVAEIDRLCRRYRMSGSSFLFADPQWRHEMLKHGYLDWRHQSYTWQNQNYKTFEDYLVVFNSNQRRNIKRERKASECCRLNPFHGAKYKNKTEVTSVKLELRKCD